MNRILLGLAIVTFSWSLWAKSFTPTRVWAGANGGDFAVAANWCDGAGASVASAPGEEDVVYIPACGAGVTNDVIVSSSFTVAELHVGRADGEAGGVRVEFRTAAVCTARAELHVYAGGILTHKAADVSCCVNLASQGDFTLDDGASLNVSEKGYSGKSGPGYGSGDRAAHGGTIINNAAACYGCLFAPTNFGTANTTSGGGAVQVAVGGTLCVNGTITANGGAQTGSHWATGTGGSVWLRGTHLIGAGRISANGGNSKNGSSPSCGGGGRVAICLSEATDLTGWSGRATAYGGYPVSGAGTVYLQFAGQTRTNATVIVDNGTNAASVKDNGGTTILGFTDLGDPATGTDVIGTLVVTNNGRVRVCGSEVSVYGSLLGRKGFLAGTCDQRFVFAGSVAATVQGKLTFPGLACLTSDKTLRFGSTTADAFDFLTGSAVTFRGSDGHPVTLAGENGGEWMFTLPACARQDVRYVSVTGSDASRGVRALAFDSTGEADSSNTNWSFFASSTAPSSIAWTGAKSTDWWDPANWDPKRLPTERDAVTISSATAEPALRMFDVRVAALSVGAGRTLTISNTCLTVTGQLAVAGSLVSRSPADILRIEGNAAFASNSCAVGSCETVLGGSAAQTVDFAGNALDRLTFLKTGGSVAFTDGYSTRVFTAEETGTLPISFAAGRTVTVEELYLNGPVLTSGTPGARWNLNVTAAQSVRATTASDSAATGLAIYADVNSRAGAAGNNDRWYFGSLVQSWVGGASGNWNAAGNWSPACVPGPTSRVTVASATVTVNAEAHVQNLVIGDDANAATLVVRNPLAVEDSMDVRNKAILTADAPIAVTNAVLVRNGGTVNHTGSNSKELYRVDITTGGDVTVESGGKIDVTSRGYSAKTGLGYDSTAASAAHGGSVAVMLNKCYGSLSAPTNYGSGGYSNAGGGAVKLFAGGTVRVDGSVLAEGTPNSAWETAAGGSVFLKARRLLGAGTVSASGGNSSNGSGPDKNKRAGGGGRVAVWLSEANDLSDWKGLVKAWGGKPSGGAGTVYLQFAGQTQTNATVIVDNGSGAVYGITEFGASLGTDFVGTLIVTNNACVRIRDATLAVYGDLLTRGAAAFSNATETALVLAGPATARIDGKVALPHVSCTVPGKKLVFGTAGENVDCFTLSENTSLTLKGESSDPLVLEGDPRSDTWLMKLGKGVQADIECVSVTNSDARSGDSVLAVDSINLGGNQNWGFSAKILPGDPITWTGASSTSWTDTANWNDKNGGHRAPISSDRITIPSTASRWPVLDGGIVSVNRLTVESGAQLTLRNGTVTFTNDVDVAGTLIAEGAERLVCQGDVTFAENAFREGASLLRLAGTGSQTVTLGSDIRFSRFEIAKTGGDVTFASGFVAHVCDWLTENAVTLRFASGSTVTADEFLCRGRQGTASSTAALTLTGAATWNLNVRARCFVTGVRAERSHGTGLLLLADTRSSDGGGNAGWDFTAKCAEWTGAADTDFAKAGNWYPEATPDAGTHVLACPRTGVSFTANAAGVASVSNFIAGTSGENAGTLSFKATAPLAVRGDWFVGTNVTVTLDSSPADNTVAGDLLLGAGATLTHSAAADTAKLNLSIGGDFTLSAGARVDVDGCSTSGGLGYPAYGGTTTGKELYCYGSLFAPTNTGAAYSWWYGGGAVKILANGALHVNGAITAIGKVSNGWETGSGGGIWLKGKCLTGSGTILARGGNSGQNWATVYTGSGGRLALHLTETDGLSAWNGVVSARGGFPIGGAGTVYVEKGSGRQGRGSASLTIDNTGRGDGTNPTYGLTPLKLDMCPKDKWRALSLVIGERAYALLQSDLHVRDLDIRSTQAKLTLNGHVLTVHSSKHRNGKGWAGDLATLVDDSAGGRIVWFAGFSVLVR